MKKTNTPRMSWLQTNVLRAARWHYWYVAAFFGLTIAYDAWKLAPMDALFTRWSAGIAFLLLVTIVWFIARTSKSKNQNLYRWLLAALVLADILIASYAVYAGRGMSSRGVALFSVAIITAAIALNRSALYAAATASLAGYVYAAVRYFTDNPSEGYKVELYGDLFFYGFSFFILAGLLSVLVRSVQHKTVKQS
jgi:hypothetical protein